MYRRLFVFVNPFHARHVREKGLQRQLCVGTLVSNQERRVGLVPRTNRWSTAVFVPPSVYIGFRLFVLLKSRSGQVCSMLWKVRGTVVSWANRSVGAPSCPAPPRPAAPPCAAPTRLARGTSGFWIRQVNRVFFVRASRDTPRRVFFDRMEVKCDGCFLGEPTCRRPVLPLSAPPSRPAVRRPVPTCPRYVRVLGSTSL